MGCAPPRRAAIFTRLAISSKYANQKIDTTGEDSPLAFSFLESLYPLPIVSLIGGPRPAGIHVLSYWNKWAIDGY